MRERAAAAPLAPGAPERGRICQPDPRPAPLPCPRPRRQPPKQPLHPGTVLAEAVRGHHTKAPRADPASLPVRSPGTHLRDAVRRDLLQPASARRRVPGPQPRRPPLPGAAHRPGLCRRRAPAGGGPDPPAAAGAVGLSSRGRAGGRGGGAALLLLLCRPPPAPPAPPGLPVCRAGSRRRRPPARRHRPPPALRPPIGRRLQAPSAPPRDWARAPSVPPPRGAPGSAGALFPGPAARESGASRGGSDALPWEGTPERGAAAPGDLEGGAAYLDPRSGRADGALRGLLLPLWLE